MSALPRPLEGIRILASEHVIAGPYGSMVLAAYGADVIRVERPPTGDMYRTNPPYIENERGRTGYGLLANNLNKRSIALDLQQDEARDIFRQLATKVDVIWENNRPGVMDRLGLGYQAIREVNPRIVYVSVSGFGQPWASDSPYAKRPAFDIVAQAMAGLLMRAGKPGDPPIYNGFALGDQFPSVLAALGCLMALRARDLSGEGQHVDISMYDSMASLLSLTLSQYLFDPELATRGAFTTSAPYGAYASRDGHFALAVGGNAIWQRFAKVIARPDLLADPTLQSGRDRAKRAAHLQTVIEEWAREKTVEEAVEIFNEAGIPAGPVREVNHLLDCPHLEARGMILQVEDPVAGRMPVMGFPIKLSGSPPPKAGPPPQFSQHADEILSQDLGLSAGEIRRLREAGIVH